MSKIREALEVAEKFVDFEREQRGEADAEYPPEARADKVLPVIRDALKAGDWISVKDRLPQYSSMVLVVDLCERVVVAEFYRMSAYWRIAGDEHVLNYVTHWMPLPKAPEA